MSARAESFIGDSEVDMKKLRKEWQVRPRNPQGRSSFNIVTKGD